MIVLQKFNFNCGFLLGSNKIASIPKLVKISDNKLMVLWQEWDMNDILGGTVKYVFIDKNGIATSEIKTLKNINLSLCQPVIHDNTVLWYTNEGDKRIFYSVPVE